MPRSVPCSMCGQLFLPSGLRFHQKVCKTRRCATIGRCPYCGLEMLHDALDGHVAACRDARRLPDGRGREASFSSTAAGAASFLAEARADGHSRCQFCGRFFVDARVHAHRAVCGRLRQSRPASLGGIRTQLPARVYNAAAARAADRGGIGRQQGSLFIPRAAAETRGVLVQRCGVSRKIGSQAAAAIRPWTVLGLGRNASTEEVKAAYRRLAKEWHPDRHAEHGKVEAEARFKGIVEAYETMTGARCKPRSQGRQLALEASSSWRAKHRELISAVRASRGMFPQGSLSAQAARDISTHDGRTPCMHCGRSFGKLQIERHMSKCANVKNRAKPPPHLRTPEVPALSSPAGRACAPGEPRARELAGGAAVRIRGLADAPHLDGATGVLREFDEAARRWHVDVAGEGVRSLRPESLSPLQGDAPTPRAPGPRAPARPGGTKSPAQGAKSPALARIANDAQQHAGHAADRASPTQRPSSCASYIFPVSGPPQFVFGASVVLEGLVTAAHLNGLTGTLRKFDHHAVRWFVELTNGEAKAIKPENLRAIGARTAPVRLTQYAPSAANSRAAKQRAGPLSGTCSRLPPMARSNRDPLAVH